MKIDVSLAIACCSHRMHEQRGYECGVGQWMPDCSSAICHRVGYGRFWTSAGLLATGSAARLPVAVLAKRYAHQAST